MEKQLDVPCPECGVDPIGPQGYYCNECAVRVCPVCQEYAYRPDDKKCTSCGLGYDEEYKMLEAQLIKGPDRPKAEVTELERKLWEKYISYANSLKLAYGFSYDSPAQGASGYELGWLQRKFNAFIAEASKTRNDAQLMTLLAIITNEGD